MTSRLARSLSRALPLAAVLALSGAVTASAAEYWLRAEPFTQTMPDGRDVTMWGYAECTGGFASCAAPTAPGPLLTVPPADGTLTVHLDNNGIPEPVSITIPGQFEDGAGEVVRNGDGRIRSFTHEVADADAPADYVWSGLRTGTYLYQSGNHPAVQVQMGLFGALVHDDAAGNAYGAAEFAYDQDLVLLYSEIAPDLHDAVRDGQYGPGLAMTSTVEYHPKYFLVNGQPWWPGRSPMALGAPGSVTLLRFLNAGLLSHYPVLDGADFVVRAGDGSPLPFPRTSYEADLFSGKTVDAFLTVPAVGYYPLVDRAGWLSSGGEPDGGMQVTLAVNDASMFAVTAATGGTGSGSVFAASLPGGIACGTDCSESYNAGTEVRLRAQPDPGSAFTGWSGACSGLGDCVVTADAAKDVTARFRSVRRVLVVSPNGGERLREGSFATISWGAAATGRRFTIQLSRNGGTTWRTVAQGLHGDRMVWKVPRVRSTLRQCRIRVLAYRANGSFLGRDVSNRNFTIRNVPTN